jgi:hypothetical protein
MNYPEALLFVGKCLTLDRHPGKAGSIQQMIQQESINWEQIVWMTSSHLVLPAFFLNLKRASLLGILPNDLVEYMEYLTRMNRKRNEQILNQMKNISALLNKHSIAPVFLKGAAHLAISLYEDVGERMMGDIDFLVEENELLIAAEILRNEGYVPLVEYFPPEHKKAKHYPRMTHPGLPASVEIHRRLINPWHDSKFSASEVMKHKQKLPGEWNAFVPCNRDLIIHNALNAQINDKAYAYGLVLLRQMYDLLQLSVLENPREIMEAYGKYRKLTNAWLALTSRIMDSPGSIGYTKNWKSKIFLFRFTIFLWNNRFPYKVYRILVFLVFRFCRYLALPLQAIFNKDKRLSLWKRIRNPKWYKAHLASYRNFFFPSEGL